jgi:hypothetical protein
VFLPAPGGVLQSGLQLFRAMRQDPESGLPRLSPTDLGVRDRDISVDSAGCVHPKTGGLSVAPDHPMNLHISFRPRAYGGTSRNPAWRIMLGDLPEPLTFSPDPRRPSEHGFVEPRHPCSKGAYVADLESTAAKWVLV